LAKHELGYSEKTQRCRKNISRWRGRKEKKNHGWFAVCRLRTAYVAHVLILLRTCRDDAQRTALSNIRRFAQRGDALPFALAPLQRTCADARGKQRDGDIFCLAFHRLFIS